VNLNFSLGEREVGVLLVSQSDAAPATVIEYRPDRQNRQVLQPLRTTRGKAIRTEAYASLVSPETGLG